MWNFRFFTLLPILFCLLSPLNFFVLGSLEIFHGIRLNFCFNEGKCGQVAEIVGYIIGGVDRYLIRLL
ncbi:hypothetical protein NIES593_07845 [Hydrococcus rivularis NIES-593]|uniref:Uncharacterized protein n=1 Tax=Hydrococcus rivularis NIES-593 TaxID=1921803 RepID=A0A1U7HKK3_9CYAN|nr:hypothetical protein NIES593_07845 [Hydrococcus rivularis NIES-593]